MKHGEVSKEWKEQDFSGIELFFQSLVPNTNIPKLWLPFTDGGGEQTRDVFVFQTISLK